MPRIPAALPFLLLCLLAMGVRPRNASAQVAAADSAAVLLEAADRFAADGQEDVARALYRFVIDNFPDTPAGVEARSRLQTVGREGTAGGGRVELQVWSTVYGLWLGVADTERLRSRGTGALRGGAPSRRPGGLRSG